MTSVSQFRADSKPLLAPRVSTHKRPEGLALETSDFELVFADDSARQLEQVRPALDGIARVSDIASACNLDEGAVLALLDTLSREGLVLDTTALLRATDYVTFMNGYWTECEFWVNEILAQPFWPLLLSGKLPPSIVLGWGVEFFHYVAAANEHMALAVAHCHHNSPTRQSLAVHYLEEAHHGEIFLAGLARCGLDQYRVSTAPALPSTRALIDYLSELATRDSLAYAATFGVMQQSRERKTPVAIEAFYRALASRYPVAEPLLLAFREHALIDADLEHHQLVFERMSADHLPTFEARGPIRLAIKRISDHFMLFFEGIVDAYTPRTETIQFPRRTLDVRSFL